MAGGGVGRGSAGGRVEAFISGSADMPKVAWTSPSPGPPPGFRMPMSEQERRERKIRDRERQTCNFLNGLGAIHPSASRLSDPVA